MDFLKIEEKWKKRWDAEKLDSFDVSRADKKKYVLEMFSYPSGANLPLGHWYNFGLTATLVLRWNVEQLFRCNDLFE